MPFRLIIHESAERDLNSAFEWAAQYAPRTANRWLNRFKLEIGRLVNRAATCPRASEAHRTSYDLRQMLFGRKPNVFRVLFCIKGDSIHVVRVLRAQMRPLTRRQIDDAVQPDSDSKSDEAV